MNVLSIGHFSPFSKLKLESQSIKQDEQVVEIEARADKRYRSVCSECRFPTKGAHSYFCRSIRDLNMAGSAVYLSTTFRKVYCPRCGIRVEDLEFVDLWQPITKRLAQYIVYLCSFMTILDVSRHLGLDWRLIRRIDQIYLSEAYDPVRLEPLGILAIDVGTRYVANFMGLQVGIAITNFGSEMTMRGADLINKKTDIYTDIGSNL